MANSNENGRGGSSSNFDERLMREYTSVPFRMASSTRGRARLHGGLQRMKWNSDDRPPVLKSMTMKEWGLRIIFFKFYTDAGALTTW